jgi:deazaflavin-dependent oxidoreductase (nitroreductase family)
MRYRLTPVRRLVNLLERARIRLGIAPRHRYLLTVIGRRTGTAHTTPVGLVEDGPDRFLVAPYGEVNWVRNARAAGQVVLERGRWREAFRLNELGAAAAAPILRRYLALEPITRPFLAAPPDAPAAAFAVEAGRHPVFRLTSTA